ncbi:hypothetical protein MHBO_000678 [Bonamia ostreae]|uniref:Pyrroline-5-carboxylate reductase n=1 Tax=Bonamia ostreae TaxID=126728 RepID=A0ABV2AGF6_9EUKA
MSIPKKQNVEKRARKMSVAFIGARVMGPAMAAALINKSVFAETKMVLCNTDSEITSGLRSKFPKSKITTDACEAVEGADLVVLCVPPKGYRKTLKAIEKSLNPTQLVISVLAGIKLDDIQEIIPTSPVTRVMPNITATVNEMASGFAFGRRMESDDQKELVRYVLNSIGTAFEVKEPLLGAVTGVSGSSPAFVLMMIEALADGGLLHGLPKDVGLKLAAQAVMGAAKMALESEVHPAQLRDRITSPGGTTIAGVQSLEDDGFRGAVINAVDSVVERAEELSEES